ncbi:putative nuclease HARBI1 [Tanacetum coccineum]
MNFDQFFFDDTDEEEEVNSLVFGSFKDAATLLLSSTSTTPIIQRKPNVRDRHGAHDHLVAAYFAEQPMYTPKQFLKCTSAIRQLAYDSVSDSLDEYLQIGTKTARDCLKHGFPGMVGSIDCTKWPWAQCPVGLRGQFWSNNDINVIRQSHLLNDLKEGKAPEVAFVANDVHYKWGYNLTDGIYPE